MLIKVLAYIRTHVWKCNKTIKYFFTAKLVCREKSLPLKLSQFSGESSR